MKRQIELLAPAGSFEALQAAVANGCDAVYLGGSSFGARAFAQNFTNDELKNAIHYAHIYGVRVFVTMNTLIYDDELQDAITYATNLQAMDVDALIIQDFGLFKAIHQVLPDMELHASTQMHIHNEQAIRYMQKCGAKRVVLPRETPIEEIKKYALEGVDLEVFVQGALCISYSGQCLMSAITQKRSGNRGMCAQSCRMQYTLEKEENGVMKEVASKGKYLLSPKDLYTIEHVPQLIEAGITSFKIEGRMKRSEYVALMCQYYRKAIDAYLEGRVFRVDTDMREEMEKIFHRGFTQGHIFHQKGQALMNFKRPNHMGITIGEIVSITKDKMRVKLRKPLAQGDGIRILNIQEDEGFRANKIYKNGLLVNHGDAGDQIEFDKTGYVQKGDLVLKTSDSVQLKTLRETFEKNTRKVLIQAQFTMKAGQPAILQVEDDKHKIVIHSQCQVERAFKTALNQERIQLQLQKTNDTPFQYAHIQVDLDDMVTMPIKELNQMRRDALEQLKVKRYILNEQRRVTSFLPNCEHDDHAMGILCIVHTFEQFMVCHQLGIKYIFVEDEGLYAMIQQKGYGIYRHHARIMKETYSHDDIALIEEFGALHTLSKETTFVSGPSLNVINAHAAASLLQAGIQSVTLSYELSIKQAVHLADVLTDEYHIQGGLIMPIYGRIELMISEYCPINAVQLDNNKKHCQLCRGKANYHLKDLKGHCYPMLNDAHCRMRLYDETIRNYYDQIPQLQKHHITDYLFTFTLETEDEVRQVLEKVVPYAI